MNLPLFTSDAHATPAPRRLPMLSTTAASRYRKCPRLYFFESVQRVVPLRKDPAARFGTVMHAGREAWMLAHRDGLPTDEWLLRAWAAIDAAEPDLFQRAKAQALMAGYHVRWRNAPIKVLHVEVKFEGPLVNPATDAPAVSRGQHGRLDAVIEHEGRPYVDELKTTSMALDDDAYWSAVRLSSQVADYILGVRHLGIEPAGVFYDVMHTPGHVPLKQNRRNKADETPEEYGQRIAEHIAERPGEYYARRVEVRLRDEMTEAQRDLWATHQQIQWSERTGQWPRSTGACRMGRFLCAFVPVCRGEATLADGTRYARREDSLVKGNA